MRLHNSGANHLCSIDENCMVLFCEFDNCTGTNRYLLNVDSGLIMGNYFHNFEGYGARMDNGSIVGNHFFDDGATPVLAIQCVPGQMIARNLIRFNEGGVAVGIQTASLDYGTIMNNGIFSNGGTGNGILVTNGGVRDAILNNVIQGFSGSGGVGINMDATNTGVTTFANNSIFDCATAWIDPDAGPIYETGNEILTESPWVDPLNGDFSPKNVGSMKEGSFPGYFLTR